MRTATLATETLAEYLRRLAVAENLRLVKSWRMRLCALAQRCDPFAAQALCGEHGPRISRLFMEIACFERVPLGFLLSEKELPAAPLSRLTLGAPGVLRRWLNLYRPHTLCIEVSLHGVDAAVRVFLKKR
ncbi:hypothetical protein [Desulfovibrio cuneatus]|uniref:hypothetical protein n=1 Tax=Desulfovibrio cuneatus TaxID=159728 RepID=UPI000401AE1F|nr:hypothetical protein [Desulfovibrio cuneatus]